MPGLLPYANPDLYDVLILGSTRSPGIVTLSGHDRFKDWDIKAAKGSAGASSALNGDPIGQFQASFYLSGHGFDGGPNDFDRWDEFQQLIESMTNGAKPIALPIYHPDLARNGFTEVSSGGVGGLIHDGLGGALVVVKFIEYKPLKKKVVQKARAQRRGVTEIVEPDPNAAAKAELNSLLDAAASP